MQSTPLAEFIKIQSFLKKNIYRLPLPAKTMRKTDSEKYKLLIPWKGSLTLSPAKHSLFFEKNLKMGIVL